MDGIPVFGSFTPWPASPDFLFACGTGVLVGVTYGVPDELRDEVKLLCRSLDSQVIRYNDFSSCGAIDAYLNPKDPPLDSYGGSPGGPHHVEIVWGPYEPDSFALAQLCTDTWYYTDDREVMGFGLDDIDSYLMRIIT